MITEPIKDNKELQAFLNFYADKKPNLRNHCLIVFGLKGCIFCFLYVKKCIQYTTTYRIP